MDGERGKAIKDGLEGICGTFLQVKEPRSLQVMHKTTLPRALSWILSSQILAKLPWGGWGSHLFLQTAQNKAPLLSLSSCQP